MFDWLFDGVWTVSLILGSAGVAFAVALCRTEKNQRYYAIGIGVVAVLFVVYFILHFLVETAAEQMERRVREITGSVKSKQIKSVLENNLSGDFHVGKYDKKEFIEKAQTLRDTYGVDSVEVGDLSLVGIDREKRTATYSFTVKPKISDHETPAYLVVAEFVMTPKEKWWQKEEWKMRSFQYFNTFADTERPLDIP